MKNLAPSQSSIATTIMWQQPRSDWRLSSFQKSSRLAASKERVLPIIPIMVQWRTLAFSAVLLLTSGWQEKSDYFCPQSPDCVSWDGILQPDRRFGMGSALLVFLFRHGTLK
jgi:hypothetical protein